MPVTENLGAIWRHDYSPPIEDYAKRFYEHFNDEFDFLIFFTNVRSEEDPEPGALNGGFYTHVKNDVEGIGRDLVDGSDRFGSAGRLRGVVFFSVYEPYDSYWEYSDFREGLLLHELMHSWANYIVPRGASLGSHWGLMGALGDDLSSTISYAGVLGDGDISKLIDHGDGKYSAEPKLFTSFSPLELYLAGFIPPEEVPDFFFAEDGNYLLSGDWDNPWIQDENGYRIFTASGFTTYSIEDIIAEHGPRVPDHSQTQKDFRAAVILLVSDDYPPTRFILENINADALWFSHPGENALKKRGWLLNNFYGATGGRGTITMDDLSQFLNVSPPVTNHEAQGD